MADKQTIEVYDAQTDSYRALVDKLPEYESINRFLSLLPPHGLVLDFGCGVGNCAHAMAQQGFSLVCVDASEQMVQAARDLYDLDARQATFADLDDVNRFDGVWANFSLLHAAHADIHDHLAAVFRALQPGGCLYIALKAGQGAQRDKLGRLYAYYSEGEMRENLANAGFEVIDATGGRAQGLAGDVEEWFGLFCRKPG